MSPAVADKPGGLAVSLQASAGPPRPPASPAYIRTSGDDITSASNTGFADNLPILAGFIPFSGKIDSDFLEVLSKFSRALSSSGALTGLGRAMLMGFVLATFAPAEEGANSTGVTGRKLGRDIGLIDDPVTGFINKSKLD
jgi:hypothetical protein